MALIEAGMKREMRERDEYPCEECGKMISKGNVCEKCWKEYCEENDIDEDQWV